MSSERLLAAADYVADATKATDDEGASERLDGLAAQIEKLGRRERGPDHGRLARLLNALSEVQATVDDDTAATIGRAKEEISRYRETVEGV